ncbi:hypothetical protein ACFL02_00915 [Planctomycetota bacterium]
MRKIIFCGVVSVLVMMLVSGCYNRQGLPENATAPETGAKAAIDSRSYNLGVIGAFAEIVGAGVKKLALSAALTPEEMDALIDDARGIAERNHVDIYRENDFLVTDLFPAEITEGKHVLLIYKGDTLRDYQNLKTKKEQLIRAGQYQGSVREAVARGMGELLSYPPEKIDALLKERFDAGN